jgi:hypothetical protein
VAGNQHGSLSGHFAQGGVGGRSRHLPAPGEDLLLLAEDGLGQPSAVHPSVAFKEFPKTTFDHCRFCGANIEKCPRSVGEISHPITGFGSVEIDQSDQLSLVVDRVPRCDVAMANNFSSSGEGCAGGGDVEGGDHGANFGQRYLPGPDGGPLQEGKDLSALVVDAEQSWGLGESMRFESAEEFVAELPASG